MDRPPPGAAILLTGGTGTLGTALRSLIPGLSAPSHGSMDVTDAHRVLEVVRDLAPATIVHAAAYTDVAAAERHRAECWRVNVGGTHAVVAAARATGARLVHISTDYVFSGDEPPEGGYKEDDTPGPVRNFYALSKLAAEEVARSLPRCLVIRTSFRPKAWPHPVAFTDVMTSQDYVDVIAPEVALAILNIHAIDVATLHIATERKTVYELARRRNPDVRPGSKREAVVRLPDDITLDISRWRRLRTRLAR